MENLKPIKYFNQNYLQIYRVTFNLHFVLQLFVLSCARLLYKLNALCLKKLLDIHKGKKCPELWLNNGKTFLRSLSAIFYRKKPKTSGCPEKGQSKVELLNQKFFFSEVRVEI